MMDILQRFSKPEMNCVLERLCSTVSVMCLQMRDALVQELQQKAEETELLHLELQMLETERVRLSLVEEKLMDVLQLLQQLRELVSL